VHPALIPDIEEGHYFTTVNPQHDLAP